MGIKRGKQSIIMMFSFSPFVESVKEVSKGYEYEISLTIPSVYMFGIVPADDDLDHLMSISDAT